ncbi:MAG: MBL fold metallo-hydrolase [Thermoplasmatota archaeon]
MAVEQIRTGRDNFSYLVYDKGIGAIVDPGLDPSWVLKRVGELSLDVRYVILTHHHHDHVGDTPGVKRMTGASSVAFSWGDVPIGDGDVLSLGGLELLFLHTPGHTEDSICIRLDDEYLITGDTLFIGDCGRCDLPGGSVEEMFSSLQKIKRLKDGLTVLPGHDYGPSRTDTLGEQKITNKVLLAANVEELSSI